MTAFYVTTWAVMAIAGIFLIVLGVLGVIARRSIEQDDSSDDDGLYRGYRYEKDQPPRP